MFFEPQNFAFIAQLRLKTIINLSLEATGGKLAAFARAQGAKLVHLGFKLWRDDDSWSPVSVELVKECIEMALRGANQPCLLMCASGHHQAGVIVACLRRCMKWSFSAIVDEFRRFADKPKSIYSTLQFVENFDPGLVTVKPADRKALLYPKSIQPGDSGDAKEGSAPPHVVSATDAHPLVSPGTEFSIKKSVVVD